MKLRVNGNDIRYEITGAGHGKPWVTLAHSLATDLSMWDAQIDALAERHAVLRYDIRGHGGSDAPTGPYAFDEFVADLSGLLAALQIERSHLVGLSLGGMIAQHFALAHPARLDKLVIVSSSSQTPPAARPLWDGRIAIARSQGMQGHVEATLGRWFTPSYRTQHPAVMARIGKLIAATPVAGYAGCGAAICALDLTGRLAAVRAPTLVVAGADDPGMPPATSEAIARAIAGARLEIMPAASHLLCIEQAAAFNRLLVDFLS